DAGERGCHCGQFRILRRRQPTATRCRRVRGKDVCGRLRGQVLLVGQLEAEAQEVGDVGTAAQRDQLPAREQRDRPVVLLVHEHVVILYWWCDCPEQSRV